MGGPSWLKKEKSRCENKILILMGDLVDLYLIINSIALKYSSMTFILIAKSKIFIHRLLRTNSVVRLSSF